MVDQKKYQNEKLDFLKTMMKASNEIVRSQKTKFNEDIISKIFETYICSILEKRSIIRKFKKIIFDNIIRLRVIKFILLFKNKFIMSNQKSLKDKILLLEAQGVKVNHKDLYEITSIISSGKILKDD